MIFQSQKNAENVYAAIRIVSWGLWRHYTCLRSAALPGGEARWHPV